MAQNKIERLKKAIEKEKQAQENAKKTIQNSCEAVRKYQQEYFEALQTEYGISFEEVEEAFLNFRTEKESKETAV